MEGVECVGPRMCGKTPLPPFPHMHFSLILLIADQFSPSIHLLILPVPHVINRGWEWGGGGPGAGPGQRRWCWVGGRWGWLEGGEVVVPHKPDTMTR